MGSDGDVSLNLLKTMMTEKTMMTDFARERDWDRFHSPSNHMLALVGAIGDIPVERRGPQGTGWNDDEKVHFGEDHSDVLLYHVRLSDICGVDLSKAALRKVRLNAIKYPATAANDKNHEETTAEGSDPLGANGDGKSIGHGGGC